MPGLKRDYLPDDLKPLLDENGFDGSIAVQARQDMEETLWLLDLAHRTDFIKGVVGWVDLCSPQLPAVLAQFAHQSKLRGVRHILQDEPDDRFMLRPDFRRGIAQLHQHGLTYDLLLHPRHLPIAIQLVQEFPQQRFVLDHIAKPLIADNVLEPWDRDIGALAKFDNVWCKLSGMVTEARWNQWKPEDFRSYLDVVFAAFGAERLMIGSDWPVCTLSAGYTPTIRLVTDYIKNLSPPQQEAVLGRNCSRFYNLE